MEILRGVENCRRIALGDLAFVVEMLSNLVRPLRHSRNFQKRSFFWFEKLNDVPSLGSSRTRREPCVSVVMDQVRTVNASAGVASYLTGNSAVAKAVEKLLQLVDFIIQVMFTLIETARACGNLTRSRKLSQDSSRC